MPNRLRKQTKFRSNINKFDRICKRGTHNDVAIVTHLGAKGELHDIQFWQNGSGKTSDADAFRIVYKQTTPFEPIDKYNKRCFYKADIYPSAGGEPIGELRVRRWFVGNRPESSVLYTVSMNGSVVYQAPGL